MSCKKHRNKNQYHWINRGIALEEILMIEYMASVASHEYYLDDIKSENTNNNDQPVCVTES
jgi:hypothetical protein